MTVSIELFLLDNLVMNALMLRLAAALLGVRLRLFPALLAALFGAAYALLSMTALPLLARPIPKLLLGAVVALPLCRTRRAFGKAVLCLYLAAFLTGGMVFGIVLLFGGSLRYGALVGSPPVRLLLIGALLAAGLPRLLRELLALYRLRARRTRIRVILDDRTLELTALLDSGCLLTEPLSGLPVVLVRPGLLRPGGRPVPYATIRGGGLVYAMRPRRLEAFAGAWREIDAFVAESPDAIFGADAIMDAALLLRERGFDDVEEDPKDADRVVCEADCAAGEAGPVHPFGGDAAVPVSAGGGAAMDRAAERGGDGGEERPDRAQPPPRRIHRTKI